MLVVMSSATRSLPENYVLKDNIDLSQDLRLAIWLNIAATILFFISIWCCYLYLAWLRPELIKQSFSIEIDAASLLKILGVLIIILVNLVLHEAIHGFFFWWFTRSKPLFALHLAYAYAAAPEWYIPRHQYAVIGLAPLLLIDAVILAILPLVPQEAILILVSMLAFNTGGAIGDIWMVSRLLFLAPAGLINDHGDSVQFYQPS